MAICIKTLRLSPGQLACATVISILAFTAISFSCLQIVLRYQRCSIICGRALPVEPSAGSAFVERFTQKAINYHPSADEHQNYMHLWADDCAAAKLDKLFAIQEYGNKNSIEFVPAYFWPPEIQTDGTLKVGMTGDLINCSQAKIKSLRLKLTYTVRRDQAGYHVKKVKLQYIKASDIHNFLQQTSKQEPTFYNSMAVLHFKWGQHAMLLKQYASAERCFTAAIKANPDFAGAYRMRADAEKQLNKLANVEADLDKAIAIAPEEWLAYFDRALIKGAYTKNDFDDYSRVIELCPGYPYAYLNRAPMQERYGTRQKAMDDYNKYIALEPKNSFGYAGKADLEYRSSELLAAYLDCQKAIALNPANGWAYRTRAQIRQCCFDAKGAEQDFKKANALFGILTP